MSMTPPPTPLGPEPPRDFAPGTIAARVPQVEAGPTLRQRGYAAIVRRAGGEWQSFAARTNLPERWRPHHVRDPADRSAGVVRSEDTQSLGQLLWQELELTEREHALPDARRRARHAHPAADDRAHEFFVRRRHLARLRSALRRVSVLPNPWPRLTLAGAEAFAAAELRLGLEVAAAATAVDLAQARAAEALEPLGEHVEAAMGRRRVLAARASVLPDEPTRNAWRAEITRESARASGEYLARVLGRRLMAMLWDTLGDEQRATHYQLRRVAPPEAAPLPGTDRPAAARLAAAALEVEETGEAGDE